MKVLVLGAAGMVGRKLVNALLDGGLPETKIDALHQYDVVMPPSLQADIPVQAMKLSLIHI